MWTSPAPIRRAPLAFRTRGADTRRDADGAVTARRTPAAGLGVDDLVIAAPAAVIALTLAARWSGGWLLLLDWSPGPRWAPWTGPRLPVGSGLQFVVGAVAALDPALLGWLVPACGVVVAYAGGVRLAQAWRGPDGAPPSAAALAVAGCVAAANPFVVSRAFAGQIGVLWGYAALWWLTAALLRAVDEDGPRSWIVPGLWLAAATASTVHMVVIGLVPVVAAGGLLHRRRDARTAVGRTLATVTVGIGVTGVWLLPRLIGSAEGLGDPGGAAAAHAFSSGGSISSLWARAAGGAAFWRPLPDGALVASGVLVAAAWAATALAWRRGAGHSRDARHLLVGCAVMAVLAAHLGRGPTTDAWAWMIDHLWPAGLLREPGKLTMLAVMAPACGAAAFVDGLRGAGRTRAVAVVVALGAATIVWFGITDRAAPTSYPAEWSAARAATDTDDCPIAVLGDGAYTNPGFTGGRVVAHPMRHFLGPRAVVSDDAGIPGIEARRATGDAERWARRANRRSLHGDGPAPRATAAGRAGLGWVVVDRPVDRPSLVADLADGGFAVVRVTDRVGVWRVPGGCA